MCEKDFNVKIKLLNKEIFIFVTPDHRLPSSSVDEPVCLTSLKEFTFNLQVKFLEWRCR